MLLLQALVFPSVALVVRARLALLLLWFKGSPSCLALLALRGALRA